MVVSTSAILLTFLGGIATLGVVGIGDCEFDLAMNKPAPNEASTIKNIQMCLGFIMISLKVNCYKVNNYLIVPIY